MIEKEEYEAWCSHPMTRYFRDNLLFRADDARATKNSLNPIGADAIEFHNKTLVAKVVSDTLVFVGELLSGNEYDELTEAD